MAGQDVGEAGREDAQGKGCGPTRRVSVSLTFTQYLKPTLTHCFPPHPNSDNPSSFLTTTTCSHRRTPHTIHMHTHTCLQALSKSMDTTTLTPEKMEFAVLTRNEGKLIYRPLTDEETARMCAKVEAEMATEGDA